MTKLGPLALLGLAALAGCGGEPPARAGAATAPGLSGIRYLAAGAGDDDGFARAREPRAFEFPRDHLAHPDYRTEWWYFTGNLFGADERHFGFELTLFRVALSAAPLERESALAADQVWLGHLALTDSSRRRFFASERLSRGAPGLAGAGLAAGAAVAVVLEDWSITLAGDTATLAAGAEDFAIELDLEGLDYIVPRGERGLDAKGPEPGNASYYFSAPRLRAQGAVELDGARHAVRGTAWMDREWSTSALSGDLVGWDWFALQLDDGRELMFYRLRERDGGTSVFSGGSLSSAAGEITALAADAVSLGVLRHWTSPATGVRYPVAWRLEIPEAELTLRIEPRIDAQELDLSVRYWEGAVSVEGSAAGAPIGGVGYLELAGY